MNEETLQGNLVARLTHLSETLSVAESCTGGMVTERITEVSGASEVFKAGYTTYTEQAKSEILGISPAFIKNHGVVSAEVACEMAKQVRKLSGSTYGMATTGWAGPSGGDEKHEVGTIFVAISSEKGEKHKMLKLGTNRQRNREMATWATFMLLLKEIGG